MSSLAHGRVCEIRFELCERETSRVAATVADLFPMATSSSGDSSNSVPEVLFHYPSFIAGINDRKDGTTVKCRICLSERKHFYCVDCVRNGDFTHSKHKCLERFADKKLRSYKLQEESSQLVQRYSDALSKRTRAETLKKEIALSRERIKLLQECIKHTTEELARAEKHVEDLQNKNQSWQERNVLCDKKIESMRVSAEKFSIDVESKKAELQKTCRSLQAVIQSSVNQLVTHIFPITEVRPPERKEDNPDENFAELEEAQQTMYVRGHWVFTGSPENDLQYCIVEPCLPASGNYSAYPIWTSQHADALPFATSGEKELCQRDLAFGISAALTFTAHLVLVLAYYLDIHMPKRLCYSEFCGHELKEQQFLYKVAKLNANVVHLCLSQNVDPSLIRPQQTILNLMLLLDPRTSDLGRFGPLNLQSDLIQSMEDSLSKDLMLMEDSDDDLSCDWVQVSRSGDGESIPSHTYQPGEPPVQVSSYLPSANIAGDLISSVASIWRAATGQR